MYATSQSNRLLSVPEQLSARTALAGLVGLAPLPPMGAGEPSRPVPRAQWEDASSLIFLHGPAGCGKTHLVNWLLNQLPATGTSILILDADTNFKSERSTRGGTKTVDIEQEPDLLIVEDLQ